MRFGLFTSMGMQTWSGVLELWQHLEKTGWDIACVTDHFFPNTKEREGAMLESWSTLSALAALVPRMRVGTIVLGNTYRHPAVVAKMAAQVDIISGGRLLLGLGAGWQQNEHEALRHPLLHDEGAAGAPGRGVPGDALAVDRAPQQLQGPATTSSRTRRSIPSPCSRRIRS